MLWSHPDETKPTSFGCFENDSLYFAWFRQIHLVWHEGNKGSLTFRVISQKHYLYLHSSSSVRSTFFHQQVLKSLQTTWMKDAIHPHPTANPLFSLFDLLKSTIIFSHSSPPLHCVAVCSTGVALIKPTERQTGDKVPAHQFSFTSWTGAGPQLAKWRAFKLG